MAWTRTRFASLSGRAPRGARLSARLRWVSVCAAALATGCGEGGQTGDEHSGTLVELKGAAQRLSASGSLPNAASADNWELGFEFYAEEATPEANTFFSPYSISVAASMLIAGAAGETKTEMQQALSFSSDGPEFHQARNEVSQALERRNRAATAERNAQTLRVTNDLWLDPQFRPAASFLDTLSGYYGASTFLAPFQEQPEVARVAINEKIATDTEQLIPELLPPNSVNDALFVLTNAIYFKARWQSEFPKTATTDEPFQAQSGTDVIVPMMRSTLGASYFAGDDYAAVALAYEGGELELVAIMPAAGTFDAFTQNLSAAAVTAIQGELQPARLDLRFPKLEIEAKVPLKTRLQALGMLQAFEETQADFSALSDGVYISDAFHDATISIDEEGTVAAAATAFVGVGVSAPIDPPIPVAFDHPFVFFVRDIETNALLFLGHYANPPSANP
jgi:serpin B